MDEADRLLRHFEALDRQLQDECPESQAKLVKEVLLARQELRQYVRNLKPADGGWTPELLRFSGGDYAIDRIQRRFADAVACPSCNATDVALVKGLAGSRGRVDYERQHSQRVRYVSDTSKTAVDFACNRCQKEFIPQLPEHKARISRMLFAYY